MRFLNLFLIPLLFFASSCEEKTNTVKIGFIGPLTGGLSANGLGGRNSAQLAVDQFNSSNSSKYTYELVALDDECNHNIGIQVATKLATNNNIIGGYFGFAMYGSSLNVGAHHDIVISDNDFTGQYYYGLYLYYARDLTITGNYIGQFTNTYNYAGYLYQLDGCEFSGNEVESYYSLLTYYMNESSAATVTSVISNNMFKNGYYGMRMYYGANVGVYHNTAVGTYYGFYDYYNQSTVDVRNNIFQGGIYSLYSYNSGSVFDYNLYYSADKLMEH